MEYKEISELKSKLEEITTEIDKLVRELTELNGQIKDAKKKKNSYLEARKGACKQKRNVCKLSPEAYRKRASPVAHNRGHGKIERAEKKFLKIDKKFQKADRCVDELHARKGELIHMLEEKRLEYARVDKEFKDVVFRKARIPKEYHNNAKITIKDGRINVFFGEDATHGHAVLEQDGVLLYFRAPGAEHGSQNYIRNP